MSESRSRPVKLHPQDKTVIDRLAARLGCTRLTLMRVGVAYLARLDRETVGQLVDEQKATRPAGDGTGRTLTTSGADAYGKPTQAGSR